MKWTGLLIGLLLFPAPDLTAQETSYKFWVQLRDKKNNAYTLDNPGEFLSQRAIGRRDRHGIALTEQDLPVTGAYLDSLMEHPLRILYTSKWMNAAIIQTEDSNLVQTLSGLSFVSGVEYLYRSVWNKKSAARKWNEPENHEKLPSDHQVEMLQGQVLHQSGFEGQGMVIAVLDAGFTNTDTIPGFDSLFMNGRIMGTRNFVEPDSGFFWTGNGTHGTHVLSIMGGDIPGEFTGSAPKAAYWLIQTEDTRSEYRVEEANWLAGAELADSAGADIINSSLGYSIIFTDPLQNYTYSDMDGKTALVTRAAQLAASRGILVVNSAGNSGRPTDEWGYITAPADGDSVLAVGAVDEFEKRAEFSSRGPSYDGRIKPDVAAQGVQTCMIRYTGETGRGDGTSYSSPVIAGLAACLWQKNPKINNYELLEAIRSSASLNQFPDTLLGFGLPDFLQADSILTGNEIHEILNTELLVCPNPATGHIILQVGTVPPGGAEYRIYDISGRMCMSGEITSSDGNELLIPIQSLSPGHFIIFVLSDRYTNRGRFIKLQ